MRLVAECSKQKEQTDGQNQTVSLLQKVRSNIGNLDLIN